MEASGAMRRAGSCLRARWQQMASPWCMDGLLPRLAPGGRGSGWPGGVVLVWGALTEVQGTGFAALGDGGEALSIVEAVTVYVLY